MSKVKIAVGPGESPIPNNGRKLTGRKKDDYYSKLECGLTGFL
jgi:hypothetical protein